MKVRLVVFDIAGTVVDDKNYVYKALNKGFKAAGYTITRDDANRVMGLAKPEAIQTLLKEKFKVHAGREELTGKIHQVFRQEMIAFYKTHPAVKAKQNAVKTFRRLRKKGILVALNTGFSRDIADTIINRLNWNNKNLIDYSVTSDEVKRGRPHPDMIYKAMKDLKILSAGHVAKVGDTPADLKEGMAAGCKYVIGITTGVYSRASLEKEEHTHLVKDLQEVVKIVA